MKTAKMVRRYLRATHQKRTRTEFKAFCAEIDRNDHRERGRRRARLRQLVRIMVAFA